MIHLCIRRVRCQKLEDPKNATFFLLLSLYVSLRANYLLWIFSWRIYVRPKGTSMFRSMTKYICNYIYQVYSCGSGSNISILYLTIQRFGGSTRCQTSTNRTDKVVIDSKVSLSERNVRTLLRNDLSTIVSITEYISCTRASITLSIVRSFSHCACD